MPGPTSSVWWRESDGWWYSTVGGKQRRLAQGKNSKTKAQAALRELLGAPPETAATALTMDVTTFFAQYLTAMRKDAGVTESRLTDLRIALHDFASAYGDVRVGKIKQKHAREWLDGHPEWARSTRSMRVAAVRAAFNWGIATESLAAHPLGKFYGPGYDRREYLPPDAEIDAVLTYPNKSYSDFCTALICTGCRPSEISRVEAKDVDFKRRCWTMTRHKNQKKKPAPRVIWLNDELLEITRRLMNRYSSGELFRNSRGRPWTKFAIVKMFATIREVLKLSDELTSYTTRHWYITRALAKGEDVVTVATMCGTSVQMIYRNYSHLIQRPDHMLAAVARASR